MSDKAGDMLTQSDKAVDMLTMSDKAVDMLTVSSTTESAAVVNPCLPDFLSSVELHTVSTQNVNIFEKTTSFFI